MVSLRQFGCTVEPRKWWEKADSQQLTNVFVVGDEKQLGDWTELLIERLLEPMLTQNLCAAQRNESEKDAL